jgi:hypothetical protein
MLNKSVFNALIEWVGVEPSSRKRRKIRPKTRSKKVSISVEINCLFILIAIKVYLPLLKVILIAV